MYIHVHDSFTVQELLVYRAGLMCAQFPMLSAPSPPEGASPTPTFPTLHFSNLGSPNDLARTAPSEMHEVSVSNGAEEEEEEEEDFRGTSAHGILHTVKGSCLDVCPCRTG